MWWINDTAIIRLWCFMLDMQLGYCLKILVPSSPHDMQFVCHSHIFCQHHITYLQLWYFITFILFIKNKIFYSLFTIHHHIFLFPIFIYRSSIFTVKSCPTRMYVNDINNVNAKYVNDIKCECKTWKWHKNVNEIYDDWLINVNKKYVMNKWYCDNQIVMFYVRYAAGLI
jgi:hypothetical protein